MQTKENKISDALMELELKIERAKCIVDVNLVEGYFTEVERSGQKEDKIKGYYLLNAYPDAQTAATIVQDYLIQARDILAELQEEIAKENDSSERTIVKTFVYEDKENPRSKTIEIPVTYVSEDTQAEPILNYKKE